MTKYAHINIRLRGFAKADTQSQIEGYLEPGKYIVKEFREKIQATYQYRQQARLKVKSRSWSGLT